MLYFIYIGSSRESIFTKKYSLKIENISISHIKDIHNY